MLVLHVNRGVKIKIETSDGPIVFSVDKTAKNTGLKYLIDAPSVCKISKVKEEK